MAGTENRDLIAQAEWAHLKPFGYAPGNYINTCQACKSETWNLDKRAITCRPCAEAAYAKAQPPAAQPVSERFCVDDMGAKTPAAQPVAWLYHNTETGGYMPIMKRLQADDRYIEIPLYATPDPRIAELEGLLRETKDTITDIARIVPLKDSVTALVERIAAALKEQ